MKDQEPTNPLLSLYLSRRQLLAVGLGITADHLLPHSIARAASRAFLSSQRPWEATPDIRALDDVIAGKTTDSEVTELPHYGKVNLDENLIRYGFVSDPIRPHIVITKKEGVVQFKRIFVRDAGAWLPAGPLRSSSFPEPEARVDPPLFYGPTRRFPHPIETQVFAKEGFANVVQIETPGATQLDLYEIHYFMPTTVEEYQRMWGQGDYKKLTPRSVLILLDGLGSSLQGSIETFKDTNREAWGSYVHSDNNYEEINYFSYRGGHMTPVGPPGFGLVSWSPLPYGPEDTYQSVFESAGKLKEMVEQIRQSHIPIDLVGYSLGGVVAWQYLLDNVLPENGTHRNNTVRSAVFLDAPLNGIPDATIVNWLQGSDFVTRFGNEATNHLAALASTPERQTFTIATNIRSAEFLRDRRDVKILCLANGDDCLVETQSAVIPGFGETIALGRGAFGIPDCDFTGLAPFLPGSDVANIGHNQILTDSRARARIRMFLEILS